MIEVTAGMIMTGTGAAGIILSIVLLIAARRWFVSQRRKLLGELEKE